MYHGRVGNSVICVLLPALNKPSLTKEYGFHEDGDQRRLAETERRRHGC